MPRVTIVRSAQDMEAVRPLWESLCREGNYTIFQDFLWNQVALTVFAGRENPCLICAESSYGVAIVPAVFRASSSTLGLLGEELFDYRTFLCCGEPEVLTCALRELAAFRLPLSFVAVRASDWHAVLEDLSVERFSAAPAVHHSNIDTLEFEAAHRRLARNLRRLARLGFELNKYNGSHTDLIRSIYQRKAEQDSQSLFHDPLRIEFLIQLARLDPAAFEIFALEDGPRLGGALVTLRDRNVRRFYTGWFEPEIEKHSPGMVLIFEVTRRSLEEGLDCDYMTGEQAYKIRLATRSEPLYRISATPRQLATLTVFDQRLSA